MSRVRGFKEKEKKDRLISQALGISYKLSGLVVELLSRTLGKETIVGLWVSRMVEREKADGCQLTADGNKKNKKSCVICGC